MESLDYLELKEVKGVAVEESLWFGLKVAKGYYRFVFVGSSGLDLLFPFVKNEQPSFCCCCCTKGFPNKFSDLSSL